MAIANEPARLNEPAPDAAASGGAANVIDRVRVTFMDPRWRNYVLAAGIALVLAVMAAIWMWSQSGEFRVLFSNFSDKDGGSIVASLEQMNVPYKITNGGSAILVPAEMVHEVRLRLASEGLPKASGVGFEVMENQKIGASQFLEQVNYQRALEGELGRTIQSMDVIQHARVHLAMHKATVFVRDQQKPTASVLLTLHSGRSLDKTQVNAIVHLVASSVPGLATANVTVVDQNGDLLSSDDRDAAGNGKLDAQQMRYVRELQRSIVKRVESILAPVVGQNNVRAEATVEVDFSHSEQAEEIFRPNQAPNSPAIRSQQSHESQKLAPEALGGIPGAVTNQPPVPPTAPLIQENPGQQQTALPGQRVFTPVGEGGAGGAATDVKRDNVINYEVDKTVRYVQQAMGGLKRMTVAVVVNYKPGKDAEGNDTLVPLSDEEKVEVTNLVKEAMGFNPDRGDSLSVLNARFADSAEVEAPIWKRQETVAVAKDVGKYLLIAAVFLYLYMAFLKPMIYKISGREERDRLRKEAEEAAKAEEAARAEELAAREAAALAGDTDAIVQLTGAAVSDDDAAYQQLLEMARQLARDNPKVVANIILEWLGND